MRSRARLAIGRSTPSSARSRGTTASPLAAIADSRAPHEAKKVPFAGPPSQTPLAPRPTSLVDSRQGRASGFSKRFGRIPHTLRHTRATTPLPQRLQRQTGADVARPATNATPFSAVDAAEP